MPLDWARDGPADVHVFTCSVYPDLTRVWYALLRSAWSDAPLRTQIFDCGGALRQEWLPGADLQRMPNWDHGRKIDLAIESAVGAPVMLIVDDDAFVISPDAVRRGLAALRADERLAVYSFHPRDWWALPAAGSTHVPMGSYALLVKPEIIRTEKLSFKSVPTSDPAIRNGSGYWDTGDFCQKELLDRGYRVAIAPPSDRDLIPTLFGTSSGFVTFARRQRFTGRYRARWSAERLRRELENDSYLFQRACSVAAAIELHHRYVGGRPLFSDFATDDELEPIARRQGGEWARLRQRVGAVRDRVLGAPALWRQPVPEL